MLLAGGKDVNGEVLLLDVGGGKGHGVQVFNEQYGKVAKRELVLHDLLGVISDIGDDALDERIKRMGHGLFEL